MNPVHKNEVLIAELLFLLLLFSSALNVNCQTVDFTISTGNNLFCAPSTVTFTQVCTGNPINFIWNFEITVCSGFDLCIWAPSGFRLKETDLKKMESVSKYVPQWWPVWRWQIWNFILQLVIHYRWYYMIFGLLIW